MSEKSLRVSQELYDMMHWAVMINRNVTMLTDVARRAITKYSRCKPELDPLPSGPKNMKFDLEDCSLSDGEIRAALAWYLKDQRKKWEDNQRKPLELEECSKGYFIIADQEEE